MQVSYRGYFHAVAENDFRITREPIISDMGARMGYTERWVLGGFIQAANQLALTAALASLEAAYSVNGGDLKMYDDNGALTDHCLFSANTISGVRVSKPFYPEDSKGAEYTTFRRYQINIEAEIHEVNVGYVAFHESLSLTGLQPNSRFIFLKTLTGPAQRQQVCQQETYKAVQSGMAVGHFGWPLFPQAIFAGAVHWDEATQTQEDPVYLSNGMIRWPISWSYPAEDSQPLIGSPTIVPPTTS